jgi:hypothetical protein
MSRITPLLRVLPRSVGSTTSRAVHTSPPSHAAAATAPRPPPRRIAVAATPRARPAPAAPAATPKPASVAQQSFDHFDGIAGEDFGGPATDAFDDYAPPAAASPSASRSKASASTARSTPNGMSNVTPSPPLSTFPNDSYRPLPTTAAGDGIVGGLGDGVNDWSTSFAGLSQRPFDKEIANALLRPLSKDDVEVKPGR